MARRGENIRKRKDGRWEGRYIKGHHTDGKTVWGYLYGSTYASVKEELTKKKALSGFYRLSGESMQFETLAELWFSSIKHGVKESTAAHYWYTLHKYLLPVLGDLTLSNLNEVALERFFAQIISPSDRSHAPLGRSLAQECLGLLKRICRYAAHLHLMSPVELCITLPRQKSVEPHPLDRSEQESLRRFLLSAPTPRKIGVLLQLELGLRIGEVCGLQWADFDLNAGFLTIRQTVCRISCGDGHSKVVVQSPKTRSSHRKIPLPAALLKLLRCLRGNASDHCWFLSGTERKPVEPRCYRKSIRGYLRQAQVRCAHPHLLRHTFATACLQAGCDIKTLSELMGHASANITLQRYVHSDISRMQTELERVSIWLQNGSIRGREQKKSTDHQRKSGQFL